MTALRRSAQVAAAAAVTVLVAAFVFLTGALFSEVGQLTEGDI